MKVVHPRKSKLIHLDSKKLGRIAGIGHRFTGRAAGLVNRYHGIGWEALHVRIDDATRLGYSEILPDERKETAVGFLERVLGWLARQGVTVERVMTDNGSAYRSRNFGAALAAAGVKHKRTGRTHPAPTAKPSGSFKPACASGPTPSLTPARRSAAWH